MMKALYVALALLLTLVALADTVSAGPPDTERIMWIVRCIGDSLGGNACHG